MTDQLDRLKAALADRYAIERELGHGGMATVYLAQDLRHQRQVALKVLRPELAPMLGAERFVREIQIAAQLNHPHILPLYDSGEAGGFLFYVMPRIAGESLRQKLEREKQLPVDEAVTIARQVAMALDHAHTRNVIHRDIKPENILLHEGEAMVADFGIALAVRAVTDGRLTGTGLTLGTVQYMSPEQAMGDRDMDARSDLYSLGCVLYEMLAGEPPFSGPTAHALIARRMVDPVPEIRRVRPAVPVAVEQALVTALARVPADRFASAAGFAQALTRQSAAAQALTQPTVAPPKARSIAVLPFLNLSKDPDNEYFADGITEDVIAHLSKVRALTVISRTSVMMFKNREQSLKEIGRRLEVATLLEGSVRRHGDRVRIVAQLIDAGTDRHLWAETYDRQLTDIFTIQTDVALNIAAALKAELSVDEQTRIRKEPTIDLSAYQLYLQGRHTYLRYTTEEMLKGVELYEQAIVRDPGYALAYAAIALACVELADTGILSHDAAYPRVQDAVANALRLDPGIADAHCARAYYKAMWEFDWTAAEQGFQRALELNPNSADTYDLYGRMRAAQGRYDEAVALVRRAQELDPLAHPVDYASALIRAGRYDEAEQAALRAVEIKPHYDRAHATLGWAYLKTGRKDEGVAQLELAASLSGGGNQWLAQLGHAYALVGREAKARDVLRQLDELAKQRYVSPYHIAFVYTGLGDHERALDLLEQAVAERSGSVYGIKGSFLFTDLHPHPRFAALLKRINLA